MPQKQASLQAQAWTTPRCVRNPQSQNMSVAVYPTLQYSRLTVPATFLGEEILKNLPSTLQRVLHCVVSL